MHIGSGSALFRAATSILAVSTLSFAPLVFPQEGRPSSAQVDSATPISLVAPLFIADQEFTSTLTLLNASGIATYADVILRAPDGSQITRARVNFPPHSHQRIDVGTLLASAASLFTTGSIVVMPDPGLRGPAIGASLSLTFVGSLQPNYIDEDMEISDVGGSQILRAVTDSGDDSPILALTSLSTSAQHITIGCNGASGPNFSKSVVLQTGESLVTAACSNSEVVDTVLHSVSSNSQDNPSDAVGIALSSDGGPGSFAAFALAPHHRRDQKFFSPVAFTDPKKAKSANTIFAGVPESSSPNCYDPWAIHAGDRTAG